MGEVAQRLEAAEMAPSPVGDVRPGDRAASVAVERPHESVRPMGSRGEAPDLRGAASDVLLAVLEALALGIRQHLPDTVGIILKCVVVCVVAAFWLFVLGAPAFLLALGSSAGVASVVAWSAVRERKK